MSRPVVGGPRRTCTISIRAPAASRPTRTGFRQPGGEESRTAPGCRATFPPRQAIPMRLAPILAMTLFTGGTAHARAAHAQAAPATAAQLAVRLAAIPAPVGYESRLADTVLALLPGARRDRAGSVVLTVGTGPPRRLIACRLDEPGWVVGGIRSDGYLTLRRLPGLAPPLFDQQLEGHRVSLLGERGVVPGVVGVRSVHLTRGRRVDDSPYTADDAFVDVGARTEAEARGLGLRETTPLTLEKRPHRYGDSLLAAPVAGARAGCAALLRAAAGARPARGSVTAAFVVEQGLSGRGILTAVNEIGRAHV